MENIYNYTKGGEAIGISKHFVNAHRGWINLATNQWKHPQSMDQSENRFSDTGISIFSSPRLLLNIRNPPLKNKSLKHPSYQKIHILNCGFFISCADPPPSWTFFNLDSSLSGKSKYLFNPSLSESLAKNRWENTSDIYP